MELDDWCQKHNHVFIFYISFLFIYIYSLKCSCMCELSEVPLQFNRFHYIEEEAVLRTADKYRVWIPKVQ